MIPGGAALVLVAAILALTAWFLVDVRLTGVAARLDTDGSEVLERDEVGPLAARAFDRVDRNGSGGIDGVELRRWTLGQWLSGRTGPVPAGPLPSAADAGTLARWVERPVAAGELDGAGLIVLRDGAVVFRHTAGDLTPERPVPLDAASKWLTGAVFACLADRGELDPQAPLASLVPEPPPGWADLTLVQLLTHTAGAPADRLLSLSVDSGLRSTGRALARAHLPEDAGQVFRYGDVSMQVAGWAAEAATGRSWRRLFVECLSWPLSLDSAAWGHPLSGPDLQAPPLLGSGLHMSLDDYGAFLSMLQQQGRYEGVRNLSPGAVRLLETERVGDLPREDLPVGVDPDWGYGLGVWCEESTDAGQCLRMSSPGAFGAFPWLDRETGLAGVVLTVDAAARVTAWNRATRELATRVLARQEHRTP